MLKRELNGNILHVTESILSFHDTQVTHWYYDIKKWMVSSHGREGDMPDRAMTLNAIAWCKKYHIPAATSK